MSITSGRHGGEVYALARALNIAPDSLLDFSSNANIFAYDLTRALVEATPYPFLHYPDTSAGDLALAVAAHENMDPARILPGNGAAELIWQVMQGLAPQKILFLGPVFSEHIAACTALNIRFDILTPPVSEDFTCTSHELERLWNSDADLVVLCNPNNPAAVVYDNIHTVLSGLRAPRVLIDLSYREFLFGSEDYDHNRFQAFVNTVRRGVSVFTLHSFTKFFCCPGIRLGYLMGDPNHLARLIARRPSWTVSPFAQRMGRVFLEHIDEYRRTLSALFTETTHLGRELRRLDCMDPDAVFEGPGFLSARLVSGLTPETVFNALLRQSMIVRNCDTIPGMPPGFIRVQARFREDSDRLLRALSHL